MVTIVLMCSLYPITISYKNLFILLYCFHNLSMYKERNTDLKKSPTKQTSQSSALTPESTQTPSASKAPAPPQ